MSESYNDYADDDHLADWHGLQGLLLASVTEFFIAYGELESAQRALLESVVGTEVAKDLSTVRKMRNVLAHALTGLVEDHNESPAIHAGNKVITPEELAGLVTKCRELTERLSQ